MNLRWLLFDIADPDLPLTFRQRLRIAFGFSPIWKLPKGMKRGRILFGVGLVAFLLPVNVMLPEIMEFFSPLSDFAGLFAILLIYWIWGTLLYSWTCRREHYYRIRLQGFDICTNCGYWLRGLGADRKQCPECGADVGPPPEQPRA